MEGGQSGKQKCKLHDSAEFYASDKKSVVENSTFKTFILRMDIWNENHKEIEPQIEIPNCPFSKKKNKISIFYSFFYRKWGGIKKRNSLRLIPRTDLLALWSIPEWHWVLLYQSANLQNLPEEEIECQPSSKTQKLIPKQTDAMAHVVIYLYFSFFQ